MLRKRNRFWHYQAKVNGKTMSWSTGETTKRAAERRVPELMRLAQLRREQPANSPRLHQAIVEEIARIEVDVGERQAECVAYAFQTFADWLGGDVDLVKIDLEVLKNYLRYRVKAGKTRTTVEREIGFLRRLLRLNGFEVPKPKMIPAPYTRNRRFSDDDLVLFFRETTDRFRPLWLVLLATGCRLADMVPSVRSNHEPVLKSEVDLETRTIYVRPSKMKIGEKPIIRPVKIAEEMVPVFRQQLNSTPKKYKYLFEMIWKPSRAFDATVKRAGLEKRTAQGKLTIHSLRATYLTSMAKALNGNAWLLKEIAGHKNIRTTEVYVQPDVPVVPISMLHLMPRPEKVQENSEMGGKDGWQDKEKPAWGAG